MPTLGVVVYSLRGMNRLTQCLESVRWADSVTVCPLDEEGPVRIQGGSENTAPVARTDWVLTLWGDECVEAPLAEAIQRLLGEDPGRAQPAYRVGVRSFLLGRWVGGSLWSPAPSLRLCRETGQFPSHWWDTGPSVPRGEDRVLPGWISDYSCSELAIGVDRLNIVSSLWARWLRSGKRTPSRTSLVTTPLWVLVRLLILKGLVFQGMAGVSLSALSAYGTLLGGMKSHESSWSGGSATNEGDDPEHR